MCEYYKNKKFKPGDYVYYLDTDYEVDYDTTKKVIGLVLSLEEANKNRNYKYEDISFTENVLSTEHKLKPIFARWKHDDGDTIGWMPQKEVFLLSETERLLYTEDDVFLKGIKCPKRKKNKQKKQKLPK